MVMQPRRSKPWSLSLSVLPSSRSATAGRCCSFPCCTTSISTNFLSLLFTFLLFTTAFFVLPSSAGGGLLNYTYSVSTSRSLSKSLTQTNAISATARSFTRTYSSSVNLTETTNLSPTIPATATSTNFSVTLPDMNNTNISNNSSDANITIDNMTATNTTIPPEPTYGGNETLRMMDNVEHEGWAVLGGFLAAIVIFAVFVAVVHFSIARKRMRKKREVEEDEEMELRRQQQEAEGDQLELPEVPEVRSPTTRTAAEVTAVGPTSPDVNPPPTAAGDAQLLRRRSAVNNNQRPPYALDNNRVEGSVGGTTRNDPNRVPTASQSRYVVDDGNGVTDGDGGVAVNVRDSNQPNQRSGGGARSQQRLLSADPEDTEWNTVRPARRTAPNTSYRSNTDYGDADEYLSGSTRAPPPPPPAFPPPSDQSNPSGQGSGGDTRFVQVRT